MNPMDPEFFKWITTLGVGGILAGLMFLFYRKDIQQYTDLWKNTTDILMIIVKDNTKSNERLIVLLENQERNALRKSDIESFLDKRLRERDEK